MKVLYKEHPRTIVICSEPCALGFRTLPQTPSDASAAVAVELLETLQVSRQNGYRALLHKDVYGCLGLIEVDGKPYLSVITGLIAHVARPVAGETVDKIYAVDFVLLVDSEWDDVGADAVGSAEIDDEAVHPCHELRKLLSNGSFYFSNDFDLTSLLQDRGVGRADADGSLPVRYLKEFMWNAFMMQQLSKFRANLEPFAQAALHKARIFTTVIRGFAKTVRLNSAGDTMLIISKQLWKRAGTRFNVRGIDDNGNVANFVELELIYNDVSHRHVYSFTQVRGLVPAFWEQDLTLINPKITITRLVEATQPIFDKHFVHITAKYGVVHILNLLSKTKPAEAALSQRYRLLYQGSLLRDEMELTEFDFHSETKQTGFVGATKILPLLQRLVEQFGMFVYDTQAQHTVLKQDGVFRTNCLDCLDRTNLIQQVISRTIVEHLVRNAIAGSSRGAATQQRNAALMEDLLGRHNALWADNGDAILQIYTGTNALKLSFLRSGKMNFAGALSDVTKLVSRMYQNTFVDSKKQTLMDILLGNDASTRPVKIYDPISEYVQEKLHHQRQAYTTASKASIFVGTFNVNAASARGDLGSWLFPPGPQGEAPLDVYAIGLQELIELSAGSILAADLSKAAMWSTAVEQQLNARHPADPYLLLRTELIASMTLLLFARRLKVAHMTQVGGALKKTGLGGIAANKGACAVRFDYGVTSFVLITSHLAAGVGATVERYNDYQTIMQGLSFTRSYTIKDHDHVIWFGDLNYRVNLPSDECRRLIENGAFDEVMRQDQLSHEINAKGAFHGFREGAVKFYPTYKFDKGTSQYDSLEKQRVPSWTDRVLYRSGGPTAAALRQLTYGSAMDVLISDHKPVYATFECPVEFVDVGKKKQMARELYQEYKQRHGGEAVLLLDLGHDALPAPTASSAPSFAEDAMSTLNLVDEAPPLPRRNGSVPRRVPPPPGALSPPPPPPRRLPPAGFSSAPLVPRSASATPRHASPVSAPLTPTPRSPTRSPVPSAATPPLVPTATRPLVPSKPPSLHSTKLEREEPPAKSAPMPPPPRRSPAPAAAPAATPAGMTMSDWKPLVPK